MRLETGDARRRMRTLRTAPRLLAAIAAATAVMTQNALVFAASFSWAGTATASGVFAR